MRLPFLAAVTLLLAFLCHASSLGGGDSNVTFLGAPRLFLDGVVPILDLTEGYMRAQTGSDFNKAAQDSQCSASSPCADGSCCNSNHQCGFRPEHCTPASPVTCVSGCDATAPCGEFSQNGKAHCPLNLCCSYFGFCGNTDPFCAAHTQMSIEAPCQGDCGTAATPSCGSGSGSASRRIAYYEAWNPRRRPCDKVWPRQIDTTGLTHLILAFATIDPKTFAVRLMNPDEAGIYEEFLGLPGSVVKQIGIGGFEFSAAGATRYTWSEMTSTKENRKAFIDSLQQFLAKWKFQGVEIDWEWPGHAGRGGNPADTINQVSLVTEMRQALGSAFGISVVLPAQYDYLKYIDVKGLEAQVSWFNVLAYDLHGPWDAGIQGLGPQIKPHTDLKEIDVALELLWSAGVSPNKVNLGVANYGRGYTVADRSCMYYGCPFTGSSRTGPCTSQEGILSACEIRRIIAEKGLTPTIIEGGAGVKQISWDDQWISFDDKETLNLKLSLANDRCLGGTTVWAIDYDICDGSGGAPPPGSSVVPAPPASSPAPSIVLPVPPTETSRFAPPAESSPPPHFPSMPSSVEQGPSRPAESTSTPFQQPSHGSSVMTAPLASSSAFSIVLPVPPIGTSQVAPPAESSRPSLPSPMPSSVEQVPSSPMGPTSTPFQQPSQVSSVVPAPSASSSAVSIVLPVPPVKTSQLPPPAESSRPLPSLQMPSSVEQSPSSPAGSTSTLFQQPSEVSSMVPAPSIGTSSAPIIIIPTMSSSMPSGEMSTTSGVSQGTPIVSSTLGSLPPGSDVPVSTLLSSSMSTATSTGFQRPTPIVSTAPAFESSSAGEDSSLAQWPTSSPNQPTVSVAPSEIPTTSIVSRGSESLAFSTSIHETVGPSPPWSTSRTSTDMPSSTPWTSLASSSPAATSNGPSTTNLMSSQFSDPIASSSTLSIPASSSIFLSTGISSVDDTPRPSSSTALTTSNQLSSLLPSLISDSGSAVVPTSTTAGSIVTPPYSWSSVIGSSVVSTSGFVIPIPVITSTPSTSVPMVTITSQSGLESFPASSAGSIMPSPTVRACPEACLVLLWCQPLCVLPFPRPESEQPPPDCLLLPWCYMWWWGRPSTTSTQVLPSSPNTIAPSSPNTIAPSSPNTIAPSSLITIAPSSAIPSSNIATLTTQSGIVTGTSGSIVPTTTRASQDGDPDSHSDSDPDCVPNNCVAECITWKLMTFFLFKRPICPCVPHKCDKDQDSDSPSDSDKDDPPVKPPRPTHKPTPGCKLFGCGCGWMGLDFGPGCPVHFDLPKFYPCGLFGCSPCRFFGCPGTDNREGVIGYDGYCLVEGGCDPCPPEICSLPGCTLSGGCGPIPGPAPTQPPNRPKSCEEWQKTRITERFVYCTEGFDVSALPSSLVGTSSTMISSICVPLVDATVTACPGALIGYDSTTTATKTSTLDAPACTRAPLSLDDDEGSNDPNDLFSSSISFSSNTTSTARSTSSSSFNPIVTTISIPDIPVTTSTSSKTSSTATSSAAPLPTLDYMDRDGNWKALLRIKMEGTRSSFFWKLYDPNGNTAGQGGKSGENLNEINGYIESQYRPEKHSMKYGISVLVLSPREVDKTRVRFIIEKPVEGCNFKGGEPCRPSMTTEDKLERHMFLLESCYEYCPKGAAIKLFPADLWCNDLNDAVWEHHGAGYQREFYCGWKGF